jgi:hypothetical protein
MSTGKLLKDRLGLSKVNNIILTRLIGTSQRIYFVWFDSMRPKFPLTRGRIMKFPYTAMVYYGHELEGSSPKKATFGPMMDIDEFNFKLTGVIFISIDLAGMKFNKDQNLTKVGESVKTLLEYPSVGIHSFFLEGYNIADLRQNAIDSHTQGHFSDRQNQSTGSELADLSWNDKNKRATGKDRYTSTLTLTYKVTPTQGGRSQANFTKDGTQTGTKQKYTIKVQFQDINGWIESRQAFLNDINDQDRKEFMDAIIKEAEVKVFSDDPSWVLQGHFYNAAELDYSIFPYPSSLPAPTGYWAKIKTGSSEVPYFSISKHVMEVLETIPNHSNKIIDMIKSKYQEN